MSISNWQVAFLWVAVAMYAASTVLFVASNVFRLHARWANLAVSLATFGLGPHGLSIILRWVEVGHGPYISFYEVASSDTWLAVALYVVSAHRYPALRPSGMVILPISFLLIGAAVFAPREGRELLPVLRSYWLVLHVTFAKLAYGPYLIGLGAAVLYLRKRNREVPAGGARWRDDPAVLDELSYRFVAFGFFMHVLMIIAGAIWAKQAWGSYWSWDPIETWSLVSWLCFAVVLHLRAVHGWQGSRAAYSTVGAVAVVIFAFFAVPFLGGSHQILLGF
ncbi:MAG: cytochrome c biogenesis protein CcsA [Bacteroidetes bacterium]|nr:cytochrome c biogenesis protein CcsA [Bacteroidota bacterium]